MLSSLTGQRDELGESMSTAMMKLTAVLSRFSTVSFLLTQVENELLDVQAEQVKNELRDAARPLLCLASNRSGIQIMGTVSSIFDCAPSLGTGVHSATKGSGAATHCSGVEWSQRTEG